MLLSLPEGSLTLCFTKTSSLLVIITFFVVIPRHLKGNLLKKIAFVIMELDLLKLSILLVTACKKYVVYAKNMF